VANYFAGAPDFRRRRDVGCAIRRLHHQGVKHPASIRVKHERALMSALCWSTDD